MLQRSLASASPIAGETFGGKTLRSPATPSAPASPIAGETFGGKTLCACRQ